MTSCRELFGEYLSPSLLNIFADVLAEKVNLELDERTLYLKLKSEKYITHNDITEFKAAIKSVLNLYDITAECYFDKTAFCESACIDITADIRRKNASLNGYFNGAKYALEGNTVNIELQHGGYKKVCELGFEELFKRQALNYFDISVAISFSGQLDDVEIAPPPPNPPEASTPSANKPKENSQKREITFGEPQGKPYNNMVYLDNPKLFYGRRIDNNIKPMSQVSENDTEICCFGEVFGFEVRGINTKRGPSNIVSFSFSDHTNSLSASMFMDPSKMGDIAPLKNGAFVLVNGTYEFDNYKKEFIVKPRAIALLQKYTETDDFDGLKRVELHCHTNMSEKDAVCSAESIIETAYKWGHKAVAITDHGVVQAYPAAAGAVKKIRKSGGDFKLIYGVEAYFVDDVNNDISELTAKQIKRYHQIILVKNLTGLKNLYKLVSDAHINNFKGRPLTLRSKLDELREGLIVGSACEAGELFQAILENKPYEELERIASYYDYLEIQPLGNNDFMVRESSLPDKVDKKGNVIKNRFRHVTSVEVLKAYNKKIVEIADKLGKPVVATGDVHFLKKQDEVIRKILMAGQGYEREEFDYQAPLYFKTTAEMLEDFSYFGERAREFVIDNPNKIAEMVSDDVIPVPDGNFPPVIEGSDQLLRDICWENAHKKYGNPVPDIVKKRLEKELNAIINNGFSIMYISAQKLVAYSEEHGYLVGSRGSVGSSFVATMAGISEVNPLAPHYVCPNCQYNEFFTKGEVGSGFDLPEKNCPHCNTPLLRDGHDIPFETFLGFKGDKVPDIDLNFSDEFQTEVQKYTETLFGSENVFKAGTISTVAEKTAFGFAKAYAEKKGIHLSNAELNRLAGLVEASKIKTTTGQHPAGMIVVPRDKTIYDFCPIQHPANKVDCGITTTHFDFHSIHDTILKLDELGHVVPTTYKYLEEYSGIPVNSVSMSDEKVYSLFVSPEALGVTAEEIDSKTGTFCLPEFGTDFVRGMLSECNPKNFADLLQISGLSHGTDVWLGNAQELIHKGICTISEVIGTRDNIMVYLIHQGMEEGRAFKITETVRKGLVAKGKVSKEEWGAMEDDMRAVNVPEWYIDSCHKIKYMFPKAHAAAYVIGALRLAWYKVYRPLEFYCAYFTARPEDVDVKTIMGGKEAVRRYLQNIKAKGKEATQKELDVYENMLIFNELMSRGIEVLPISLDKSHAMKYLPEDGKMRLPFGALSGVGEKAAYAIYETAQKGNFVSLEDFQLEAGVSSTIIKNLADLGAMKDLPETNQISMF
ncbi:MAG: PolC-type DNA polymerase III [Oscillospiraceae bacterium]|nr:PolC-type DNA polymerase III [Oscillospiraceae bacterium]